MSLTLLVEPGMPPAAASLAYHEHLEFLTAQVDQTFLGHPDLGRLLGPNPFDLIQLNHVNHGKFMDNVFFLGNAHLLVKTIPWVYRVYGARGVSLDYFPEELRIWQQAIEARIPAQPAESLLAVYQWMIDHHADMILAAARPVDDPGPPMPDDPSLEAFITALVTGDRPQAEAMTAWYQDSPNDLERLYLELLDPAMQKVGQLWEQARITVAQEHMASSLVTRMMSRAFSKVDSRPHPRKRCLVSASPNEQHQIGAWMISDLMETRGWATRFLGADTPTHDLLATLEEFRPGVIALSVTMAFNLRRTTDLIREIRQRGDRAQKIMVGGRVFQESPGLAQAIGADGEAADARGACLLAESWFEAGHEPV